MILFFSSDENALFQKDVLSALSLPNRHCVHFRYWEEIVSKSILDKFDRLGNLEGILIYVKNNDSSIEKRDRKPEFFPVRKVEIVDYRKDLKTGLIHFNLELGDFVNPTIIYPQPEELPPFKMLSEGSVSIINSIAWHEKVENLVSFDNTLRESLFYNFNLTFYSRGDAQTVESRYDPEEEASFFRLLEGRSYIIELSVLISDSRQDQHENYECMFEYDKKDILITNPSSVIIGTKKDSRRYRLITKSISSVHSFDYLKLISRKKTGEDFVESYETIIRFNIVKSKRKAFLFVVLFFFNVMGTTFLAYLISSKRFEFIPMAGALSLVLFSALGQYFYYNKS